MRLKVTLYVNGKPMRNWEFVHRSEGVPEYSDFKLDLTALSKELHGYEEPTGGHLFDDRITFKIETHPE